MARQYVRFSASIRPDQKEALEKYAEQEELLNQYGEPAMNKALREILDKNGKLKHLMDNVEVKHENRS